MPELELRDYKQLVDMALLEDVGGGDLTSMATIPANSIARAAIYAKQDGVVCGLALAKYVFARIDKAVVVKLRVAEGDKLASGQLVLTVEGSSRSILSAERTALNFLARLSGIATATALFVSAVEGSQAKICDTRKTLPGWRKLEKYAVAVGGGCNHRIGLWDAILIKENHIRAAGGILSAMARVKEYKDKAAFVQIEVETLEQLREALDCQPDMVLLDNMDIQNTIKAVEICRKNIYNILIEASGNINIENVAQVAGTGVDRISSGAITHSAKNFDYTLLIKE